MITSIQKIGFLGMFLGLLFFNLSKSYETTVIDNSFMNVESLTVLAQSGEPDCFYIDQNGIPTVKCSATLNGCCWKWEQIFEECYWTGSPMDYCG